MNSLAGVAQWVRLRGEWLSEALPETPKRFPLFGHIAYGSIFPNTAVAVVCGLRFLLHFKPIKPYSSELKLLRIHARNLA
jgi:hypothetical protein